MQHQTVLVRKEKVKWSWHFQVAGGILLLAALVALCAVGCTKPADALGCALE